MNKVLYKILMNGKKKWKIHFYASLKVFLNTITIFCHVIFYKYLLITVKSTSFYFIYSLIFLFLFLKCWISFADWGIMDWSFFWFSSDWCSFRWIFFLTLSVESSVTFANWGIEDWYFFWLSLDWGSFS